MDALGMFGFIIHCNFTHCGSALQSWEENAADAPKMV